MTYVVDVLERHSRLHPGQKKGLGFKVHTYIRYLIKIKILLSSMAPQAKPKDHQSTTTSSKVLYNVNLQQHFA